MDRFESNIISHLSLVVRDIEKTARNYSELFGVPMPEIIHEDESSGCRSTYAGREINAAYKIAFIRMGLITLELIQPGDAKSVWKDFLEHNGEGIHHMGFNMKNGEETLSFLQDKGLNIIQKTENKWGKNYYVDTHSLLGVMLELCEKQKTK